MLGRAERALRLRASTIRIGSVFADCRRNVDRHRAAYVRGANVSDFSSTTTLQALARRQTSARRDEPAHDDVLFDAAKIARQHLDALALGHRVFGCLVPLAVDLRISEANDELITTLARSSESDALFLTETSRRISRPSDLRREHRSAVIKADWRR